MIGSERHKGSLTCPISQSVYALRLKNCQLALASENALVSV